MFFELAFRSGAKAEPNVKPHSARLKPRPFKTCLTTASSYLERLEQSPRSSPPACHTATTRGQRFDIAARAAGAANSIAMWVELTATELSADTVHSPAMAHSAPAPHDAYWREFFSRRGRPV